MMPGTPKDGRALSRQAGQGAAGPRKGGPYYGVVANSHRRGAIMTTSGVGGRTTRTCSPHHNLRTSVSLRSRASTISRGSEREMIAAGDLVARCGLRFNQVGQ